MDDRLRRFKVMSVSLMGTLVKHEAGIVDYIKPIAARAGVSLAAPAILEAFSWAEERQIGLTPELTFCDMLAPIYQEMAGVLGLPTDGGQAEAFRKSVPDWAPFPDAAEALKRLARHWRLVAFTNADNISYWAMAKALDEPFSEKVTSEDVGACKPNGQMFAYLRGQQSVHGFNRGDILHVSQSKFHDVALARKLGFATAWIERRPGKQGYGATPAPAEPVDPDFHYRDLTKFADAVDEALGG